MLEPCLRTIRYTRKATMAWAQVQYSACFQKQPYHIAFVSLKLQHNLRNHN